MTIIGCEGVRKYFHGNAGSVKAVDGVSLALEKGDSFGLVGESGSGKTTLGKIFLGILNSDSGKVIRNTDRIQAVFQDPYNSLDPKMKVCDILAEGFIIKGERSGIAGRIEDVLDLIKLPKIALKKYPHQFSGGERQRIAIGRAILTRPEFIVCDEPVSSLDVTIQLEILKLLKEAQKTFSMTYLFISHDLRVVKFMCNKIAVMHDGKIIESGATNTVYENPSQEYTRALLSSALYGNIK